MFIAVDGPNGVGKSSVIAELVRRLEGLGHSVVSLRQPSDSDVGSYARDHHDELTGMVLAVLVVADRYWQIGREIKPALATGNVVVLDRYVASTLVLQRIDGLDPELMWELNAAALVPDVYFLLTASPDTIHRRLRERGRSGRFDKRPDIAELECRYYRDAAGRLERAGYRMCSVDTESAAASDVAMWILDEVTGRLGSASS